MTQIVLPYRPVAGDPEDISQVIADFDSILTVVNGDLRDDNISPSAAIQASKLAAIPGSRIAFSRGTTPPASPADGDLWQLQVDAAAGIYWMFRYNAGSVSTFKWEFLGGAPLMDEVAAIQSTASAVYADLGTVGPQVTLPRAGDYVESFGCKMVGPVSLAWRGHMAIKRALRILGVAAADVHKAQYRQDGGATITASIRWLSVLPIRVS